MRAFIKGVGGRLKRFCGSQDSYIILDSSKAQGGTWTEGGCLILAHAMQTMLARYDIPSSVRFMCNTQPQHAFCEVVLESGDVVLLDGDGASTMAEMFKRWIEDEVVAQPIGYKRLSEYPDNMPQPGVEQDALVEALQEALVKSVERKDKELFHA